MVVVVVVWGGWGRGVGWSHWGGLAGGSFFSFGNDNRQLFKQPVYFIINFMFFNAGEGWWLVGGVAGDFTRDSLCV